MLALTEKYKPAKLHDFAGLAGPRTIFTKLAASPYESAWLLVGPSGTGKTTLALAFAAAIGAELHHIPAKACDLETVERVTARCHYAPMFGTWHLILVDEADQMSGAAQLAFLSKLDGTATPPFTIVIFTANETRLLADRFQSRCRVIPFRPPDPCEVLDLCKRIWRIEAPDTPMPNANQIMTGKEINVRSALMNLELEIMAPGAVIPQPAINRDCSPCKAPAARNPHNMPDPARSAACRRAWETIRANRLQKQR
jgi:putative ATPase